MTIVVLQDFIQYLGPTVTKYIIIDSSQIIDINLDDNIQFLYFFGGCVDVSTV